MTKQEFIDIHKPRLIELYRNYWEKQAENYYLSGGLDEFNTDESKWLLYLYNWLNQDRFELTQAAASLQFSNPETYETTKEYIDINSEISSIGTDMYYIQRWYNLNGWALK